MPCEARVLADFDGTWRLHKIISQADGTRGSFDGTATWTRQGDRATLTEKGLISLGGATPLHAERRYVWTAGLAVYFDDGRFFHQVPARGGTAAHRCDPDQYDAVYDFSGWPAFRVSWQVQGPRKDYRMDCYYTRA